MSRIVANFRIQKGAFNLEAKLDLPANGVSAIYGPSGSGKTTLLRALAGLDRHAGGRLSVAGEVWQGEGVFQPPEQRGVGVVFQEGNLFSHLSVEGNLRYALRRVPSGESRIELGKVIKALRLEPLLKRSTQTLSGGERQRVAIGRALLSSPRLLLLDEPLVGLETSRREALLEVLEDLRNHIQCPIVLVSHALDEVIRLSDFLVLLDQGCVVASGPTSELLTRLDLPLAQQSDACVVLNARVLKTDVLTGHSELSTPAGLIRLPGLFGAMGRVRRLRIAARDVSVARSRVTDSSILNILPAVVEAMSSLGNSESLVRLRVGEAILLARISHLSLQLLELKEGDELFAQVKGVALLGSGE